MAKMNGYYDQYQVVEPKYVYIKDVLGKDGKIDYDKLHGKVLVVKILSSAGLNNLGKGKYYCSDAESYYDEKANKTIDIKHGNFKIFVTEKLRDDGGYFGIYNKYFSTVVLPKIFSCNLSSLHLQDQDITVNDYLMLVSSGTLVYICFITTNVYDKNKKMVPLEKLCEHLLNIEEIHMQYSNDEGTDESERFKFNTTDQTAQGLLDLPCFKKLKVFSLSSVQLERSFKTFARFMKKHAFAKFDIKFLSFREQGNLTIKEKAELNKIKNELLETWPTNDKPEIWF